MNNISTVIIQAGGQGIRLRPYTMNKPKCLVPLNGKPLLEYSLEKFKNCNIIIITDYKSDVLESYVNTFYSQFNIKLIKTNKYGTCSGIKQAISLINNQNPIALIWSDLILEENIQHNIYSDIQVFTTDSFPCRYKLKKQKIIKEDTKTNGILGLFTFKNKNILSDMQEDGSFVGQWLKNKINFSEVKIKNIKEIGTIESLNKETNKFFCRFFNQVEKQDSKIIKKCINDNFKAIHEDEKEWYKIVSSRQYKYMPKIFSYDPLTLEYIKGKQCHDSQFLEDTKENIIKNICNSLKKLHEIEKIPPDLNDIKSVYVTKACDRVKKASNLIPFIKFKYLLINGKLSKNPFHQDFYEEFIKDLNSITCKNYNIIHGDPTFSNILIKNNLEAVLIDPRGSFGKTKIYGDKDYDWAKLYYSLNGNYDSINLKKYSLTINENKLQFSIKSSGWENFTDLFYELSGIDKRKNILLNSSIWFSLCGYVVEDYDAINIAFLKGVELWNLIS